MTNLLTRGQWRRDKLVLSMLFSFIRGSFENINSAKEINIANESGKKNILQRGRCFEHFRATLIFIGYVGFT